MASPHMLLKASQMRAKKQLGQNFLTDPQTAEAIVARSRVGPRAVVLEIGAGLGALTVPLARKAARVLAVEKDRELVPLLKTELRAKGITNVAVTTADILVLDWESLAQAPGQKLLVMGNLPYNISSQILVRLVRHRHRVERAVLMFQKELAQRITAAPGNRDYGRLAVMLQYCARIRPVMDLKASQFYPRPKVDSIVLEIEFHPAPPTPADDEEFFSQVVKAAFGQRRKTLRNALSGSQLALKPTAAAAVLQAVAIDPSRRAETLSIAEFVALSNALGRRPGTE
ncbi:MAG: 16S rRNA (adenine(1518)-N(6)/adenine(1519)-N(6))-dimethyltransferase RsmA [Desulfobacterales bacterium]